ncbi:MAG: hypothetical protein ACYC1D_05290 [Acidimicrobiales bacterium]
MVTLADALYDRAAVLGASPDRAGAVAELTAAAGDDLGALEAARDRYARHLHGRSDDWEATAALTLLNRAVASVGKRDPFDWKERWGRHRKP